MISKDYITEWRDQAPWATDAQVEQDLIISRAVVEIFKAEDLALRLAWRGGTALFMLHLRPGARYSEDIDLVQIASEPIGSDLPRRHDTAFATRDRLGPGSCGRVRHGTGSRQAPWRPLAIIERIALSHFAISPLCLHHAATFEADAMVCL